MPDPQNHFFSDAEWGALPVSIRTGFCELALDGVSTSRQQTLGRVLLWLLPAWVGLQPRLHAGPRGNPQISWIDGTGASAEIEIREDRLVWYVEGQGEGSELM